MKLEYFEKQAKAFDELAQLSCELDQNTQRQEKVNDLYKNLVQSLYEACNCIEASAEEQTSLMNGIFDPLRLSKTQEGFTTS